MKAASCIRASIAAVLAASLVAGFVCEEPVFAKAFFPKEAKTVAKRIAHVQKKCAKKFPLKTKFVTLNGGFVRMIGQHLCNGVVRMKPGDMLVDPNPKRVDMRPAAASMADCSAFCSSNGVGFLYVQLPKRLDATGKMLPPGVCDSARTNADDFLAALARGHVDAIDLRPMFAGTPDDVRANFFRTDHHWKIETALRASTRVAGAICSRLAVDARRVSSANDLLVADNWTRDVVPNAFLGSLGRRTGHLYAVKDDLVVLRPKFKSDMTMTIPERNWQRSGTFEETVMWRLDEVMRGMHEDAFSIDAYTSLYIGGLYAHVRHENRLAPIDKKILLIGDSFSRPVEGFLSVVFKRLDFIDLRRCREGFSLAEFVRRERPDIVVQVMNPSSLISRSMVGVKSKLPIMFEYGLPHGDRHD